MEYKNIVKGEFIKRPNRFIGNVIIDGTECECHIKNTGRCKELLVPMAEVYLEKSNNPNRKTMYDLVSVRKGNRIINIDSQAPNRIFREWAETAEYFKNITQLRGEVSFGKSRLDFYIETESEKIFAEVKGVTLESNDTVSFPDAPTERGVKHINELIKAKHSGYRAIAVFVVQMDNAKIFVSNDITHPAFGAALREAYKKGVEILVLGCKVTPNSISAYSTIPFKL